MMSDEIYNEYCRNGTPSSSPLMYQNNANHHDLSPITWLCRMGILDSTILSRLDFNNIVPWTFVSYFIV